MTQPIIFLSHETADSGVARLLKSELEGAFLGIVDIFVSSDPASIRLGDKWLETITANLKAAVGMLVLATPNSVGRPWVTFEAGAAWVRDVPVIPLCHSGMTPGGLPMPLQALQSVELLDPAALRHVVQQLASQLGCNVPSVDYEELVRKLREVIAAASGGNPIGSEVRQPSRSTGGVRNGSPEPSAATELPPAAPGPVDVEVLKELRDINRKQARTSEILSLDLDATASRLGTTREAVQDALSDVLADGRAEPYAATFGQPAEEGACRITKAGMAYLTATGV